MFGTVTGRDVEAATASAGCAVDFAFLAMQTFGDRGLERDLLDLFLAQARRQIARLPGLDAREQTDIAHLLKGSCQGIGAWDAACAAQLFEDAAEDARPRYLVHLADALAAADAAIRAHLASS